MGARMRSAVSSRSKSATRSRATARRFASAHRFAFNDPAQSEAAMTLNRRTVLSLAATSLAGPAWAQAFVGRQLTAQGFGGPTQDIIQQVVFDPMDARIGSRSTQVSLQSAAAFARMKAEAAAPQIDLYQFSGGQEQEGQDENLASPLEGVPNLAVIPASLRGPVWVTYGVIAQGLLYRTDKLREAPRSYL